MQAEDQQQSEDDMEMDDAPAPKELDTLSLNFELSEREFGMLKEAENLSGAVKGALGSSKGSSPRYQIGWKGGR